MIEELAVVEQVKEGVAFVRTQRQTACQSCSAKKGCGTRVLNQLSDDKQLWQAMVTNGSHKLKPGDTVVVGLSEEAFLSGSAAVYGLPLLGLFALASIASLFGASDPIVALTAFAGLAAGLLAVNRFTTSEKRQATFKPVVLRKILPVVVA